jgi:hypothetical protein
VIQIVVVFAAAGQPDMPGDDHVALEDHYRLFGFASVVAFARGTNVVAVRVGPFVERGEGHEEGAAELGQRVVDAGRDGRVCGAGDEAVAG